MDTDHMITLWVLLPAAVGILVWSVLADAQLRLGRGWCQRKLRAPFVPFLLARDRRRAIRRVEELFAAGEVLMQQAARSAHRRKWEWWSS